VSGNFASGPDIATEILRCDDLLAMDAWFIQQESQQVPPAAGHAAQRIERYT
jgi:hypothetical protein